MFYILLWLVNYFNRLGYLSGTISGNGERAHTYLLDWIRPWYNINKSSLFLLAVATYRQTIARRKCENKSLPKLTCHDKLSPVEVNMGSAQVDLGRCVKLGCIIITICFRVVFFINRFALILFVLSSYNYKATCCRSTWHECILNHISFLMVVACVYVLLVFRCAPSM